MTPCLDCHDKDMAKATERNGTKAYRTAWALNHCSEAKGNAIDCAACHDLTLCHAANAIALGSLRPIVFIAFHYFQRIPPR
jgi:formate-dependent nitrite reductase cytochrome c552 subunit